ncbi:MAG TPA: carbonic anhydrase [Burkholderiales bacterium]|nr:carbonic anhydrase [Burkholderiales bacterium]
MEQPKINQNLKNILNDIYETNNHYVKMTNTEIKKPAISQAQHPIATLVMCCDSRAHTTSFTYKPENNFFIVRNIGNQYILNQGSVEYGVRILKTDLLIFLGHSQCQAVKASMEDYTNLPSSIVREVDHLALSIKKSELHGDLNQKWCQAVVNNIHKQVEMALKDFADLVMNGKLIIIGMILDLDNSVGGGYGKITITNYNNVSDINKLKEIDLIKHFFD